MERQYSIAQARDHLAGIVHEVERGSPVELTRRGKPVAVILSLHEYRRLASEKKRDFWEAVEEFRRSVDPRDLEGPDPFEGVRDRSPGREFEW